MTGTDQVAKACEAAEAAFDVYRAIDREARAAFLEKIGEEIMALGDALIEAAMRESHLPRPRLEGERGRTVGQLKMFANVVRDGGFLDLRIDPAMPDRQPLPRPDLRLRMIPLGPVAVFGASNFPLAFSTAGGDTASALAAGCPVVVKGHPAHPDTGELVAGAIRRAVAACGLPEGVFGHVTGDGFAVGEALVQDPRIAAVGFTGSRGGGLALAKLCQSREVPIPIYSEMSSINPVLLFAGALADRAEALGKEFAGSLTMGVGQFCTNPGLLLAIDSPDLDTFVASASAALSGASAGEMLTGGIHAAYAKGVSALENAAGVKELARGQEGSVACGQAMFFETSAKEFLANKALGHEVFGPTSLLIRCADEGEMRAVLAGAEGQLTATLHMTAADEAAAAALLPVLERKVGRILVNGWPTGVEVTHAMVHGGPFPATSDARTTSVGSLAIDRFLRPVSYQNFAQTLLPPELRDEGAAGVPRRIDGRPTVA